MRSYRFSASLIAALCLAMAMVWTGCPQSDSDSDSAKSAEPMAYRLKWLFNTSVVGELWAMKHDFFKDAGLDVTVKPGGPEQNAIKELELGHARFGVASADMVIHARAKGSPVVVVAQLFQVNPLQWIYRADKISIDSPADLKGKVLGVTFGGNDEAIMRALLANAGIHKSEAKLFSVRYDYTPFYEGRVDLWPVYRNAQGIIIGEKLEAAGESVAFFDPHEAGVRFVANSVVTTEAMVADHPETVRRFVTALLSAWEAALDPENAEAAAEIIHQHDPDTPLDQIRQQLAITRRMVKPSPDFPIGTIDRAAWEETERIMLDGGLIEAPVNVTEALRPY